MNNKIQGMAGLVFVGLFHPLLAISMDLSGLLNNSPFPRASAVAKSAKSEQNQVLELRGIVVENGVTWFTLYESTSKKWMTVREGQSDGAVTVERFNPEQDTVAFSYQGKIVTIGMSFKAAAKFAPDRASVAEPAVASTKQAAPLTAALSIHSPAEAKRLDLVAALIRQAVQHESNRIAESGATRS